jgi:hypothetical protein
MGGTQGWFDYARGLRTWKTSTKLALELTFRTSVVSITGLGKKLLVSSQGWQENF